MSYYGSNQKDGFYTPGDSTQGYPQQQQQQHSNTGYAAPANAQAWQANTTSSQEQQQSYAPAQAQAYAAPAQPSVWNPAAAAAMMAVASGSTPFNNDAMFQSLSTVGQAFFTESSAKYIPGLESTMVVLRNYFAVDNRYVLRKLQKVLFPFFSKDWQRQVCI